MKLSGIFRGLLKEEDEKIVKFPKHDFSISLFKPQRKIVFNHLVGSVPSKMPRIIIEQLKNNFRVKSVRALAQDSLEVVLEATENFGVVVDFIKKFVEENG